MNAKTAEFVERIDQLLEKLKALDSVARASDKQWMFKHIQIAVDNLTIFRQNAAEGILPQSNGSGLGLSRALGEWAPKEVCDLGYNLEIFYIENM